MFSLSIGSLCNLCPAAARSSGELSGAGAALMSRRFELFANSKAHLVRRYSQEVHDHFQKPRNVGSFDTKDPSVGTAVVGKASCGDVIKLQVRIENDVIQDVRFKAFGCGSAIASSSFASELIKGKTCDEAMLVKNVQIAESLSLPPVKIHCSLLAEDAVRHAIKDYRSKKLARIEEAPLEC